MLKLMLILLAFFVHLHGRSEPSDDRAAPVLHSLAARFAGLPTTEGGVLSAPAGTALGWQADLRRRLIGHLPITASPLEAAGDLLGFDLPDESLFEQRDGSVRRDRRVLLHRLAAALDAEAMDQALVLVVTTAGPAAGGWQGAAAVPLRRLQALATVLRAAGLAPSRLRLGFAHLPDGIWRFAIRSELGDVE